MIEIYIDIETFSGKKPSVEELTVPKTFKKAESIQKWKDDPKNLDEVWRKQSLDRFKCQVISIAVIIDNGVEMKKDFLTSESEEELILWLERTLFDNIRDIDLISAQWITYYGNNFDLPILTLRALKYGRKDLFAIIPHKKWDNHSYDLSDVFKFTDYQSKASMKTLLDYFGLEGKTNDMDGGKVHDAFLNKEYNRIGEYCMGDVEALVGLKELL